MGNQMLYDLTLFAILFYLTLCLCLIGRPSLAIRFLRKIRCDEPSMSSSKRSSWLEKKWPVASMHKHS